MNTEEYNQLQAIAELSKANIRLAKAVTRLKFCVWCLVLAVVLQTFNIAVRVWFYYKTH
jgi:hypothetical protein